MTKLHILPILWLINPISKPVKGGRGVGAQENRGRKRDLGAGAEIKKALVHCLLLIIIQSKTSTLQILNPFNVHRGVKENFTRKTVFFSKAYKLSICNSADQKLVFSLYKLSYSSVVHYSLCLYFAYHCFSSVLVKFLVPFHSFVVAFRWKAGDFRHRFITL